MLSAEPVLRPTLVASLGSCRVKGRGSHSATGLGLLGAGLKVCTSSPPGLGLHYWGAVGKPRILASFFLVLQASILLMPISF